MGLRRHKRLSFRVNSAAEIFQHALCTALEGIEGAKKPRSDDIIVFGATQTEHDERLEVIERLQVKGSTLDKNKCKFNKRKLEFFG